MKVELEEGLQEMEVDGLKLRMAKILQLAFLKVVLAHCFIFFHAPTPLLCMWLQLAFFSTIQRNISFSSRLYETLLHSGKGGQWVHRPSPALAARRPKAHFPPQRTLRPESPWFWAFYTIGRGWWLCIFEGGVWLCKHFVRNSTVLF